MTSTRFASPALLEKLDALRTELGDLAFHLEQRGRLDAADLAVAVSGRLAELCEEAVSGIDRHVR